MGDFGDHFTWDPSLFSSVKQFSQTTSNYEKENHLLNFSIEISSATSFFAHHRLQSTYTSIQLQRKVEQLLPSDTSLVGTRSRRNRDNIHKKITTGNDVKTPFRSASMDRNPSSTILHSESKIKYIINP